jgi:hypothetical protein
MIAPDGGLPSAGLPASPSACASQRQGHRHQPCLRRKNEGATLTCDPLPLTRGGRDCRSQWGGLCWIATGRITIQPAERTRSLSVIETIQQLPCHPCLLCLNESFSQEAREWMASIDLRMSSCETADSIILDSDGLSIVIHSLIIHLCCPHQWTLAAGRKRTKGASTPLRHVAYSQDEEAVG